MSNARTAAFCYAVANLYLLPFWVLAFGRNGMPLDHKWVEHYYELSQIFSYVDYLAAVLLSLLMAAVIFVFLLALGRVSEGARQIAEITLGAAGLVVLAAAIWVVASPPSGNMRVSDNWIYSILIVAGLAAALLLAAILFFRTRALEVVRAAALWCVPIGLILAANAAAAYVKSAPPDGGFFAVDHSLAPLLQQNPNGPRVVFILFDMWDQRLTFEARSPDVSMPEIDRFKGAAFFATRAERAGAGTLYSLPGMVTGRKVMYAWQAPHDTLQLVFAERTYGQPWTEHPGIFREARENGYNTSVITTAYHPYCRMFRQYISACWIDDTPFAWKYKTVLSQMDDVVLGVLRQVPYLNRLFFKPRRRYDGEWGLHLHHAFREEIKAQAVDPRYQFLFVHYYLPHPPYVYDHKANKYIYDASLPDDYYWGNLEALDIAFGQIRRAMEEAGVWDKAVVILTADHGFTLGGWSEVPPDKADPRVPFLVKMPGQTTPIEYDEKFRMTSLHEMLGGIFSGKLERPEQIPDYLSYPVYYH